jgi:hypothetical protein
MSLIGSQFGNVPGMGTVIETFEQAITWGPAWGLRWWNAYINANAVDPGNNPTWKLRPGLVMGIITATGQWTNYSPTASDGSQIAIGVLAYGLRMQDVLSGLNTSKFYAVIVGGGVKGANLLGLDNMARAQMSPRFVFDDNLLGNIDFEFLGFVTKTANYQVLASDNFVEFNNIGAVGPVTFTLPAIAPGYKYGFRVVADQNLTIASSEGANIVGFNNAVANTLAFSTAGARIGGGLILYTNQAGTKWFVENNSAGANTITVA